MFTRENTVLQKTLGRILGCALLSYGGAALAFTLIPQELVTPSTTITNVFTLQAQVQPIAGTIRAQIFGLRRPGSSKQVTQVGGMMLAANDRSGSASDVNYLAAAANDPSGAGSGSGGGNAQSLWISSTTDSLENTFSRTAFYGATQNVIVGYDFTRSDKYVFGISGGYEASNFVTKFNSGNEKTGGYNLNPYFAWLLSDRWSLDLIGGYGKFSTNQSRAALTGVPVDSDFSSKRSFASTNLSNISAWGNWKLTSSLGYLWSQRDQHGYDENGGSSVAGNLLRRAVRRHPEIPEGRVLHGRAAGQRSHQRFADRRVALFRQGPDGELRVQRARGPGAGQGTRFLDGASRGHIEPRQCALLEMAS